MPSFSEIPSALRVPGTFLEVDPSLAEVGVGAFPLRGLIIAPKIAAGSVALNTPTRVTSAEQASALAGAGSMLSRMAAAWFSVNQSSEVDVVAIADGTTARQATIGFSGTTVVGNVAIYIAGDRYVVNTNQTSPLMAAELKTLVDANPEAPFTTSVSTSTVTLTAKNAGALGTELDIRSNHQDGEETPTGITVTINAASVAGTGDLDLSTAIAAISGVQYDVTVHPTSDATNLSAIETELASRADAMQAIPGHAFTGFASSQGVLAALGNTRNSSHSSILGFETFPGVSYERASAVAGLVAKHGSIDPARPFQTLALPGFAPAVADRFSLTERNLLLYDGISTTVSDRAGQVRVERLITTYQENAAGAPSAAFLDVNLMLSLSFYRRSLAARIASRFPRHKLASDSGTPPASGTALVTPKVFLAEVVSHYQELVEAGICEDLDGFASNSTVAIASGDVNRVDATLAPNFVNQLRVSASLVQFRL